MDANTQNILITTGAALISSLVSSVASWFMAKKKYDKEVEDHGIKNMHSSLDFYEDLSDDSKQRLHSLLDENRQLREENIRIREENAAIRVDNAAIRAENARVMKELEDLKLLVNRILESTCVNMACQIRNRGFAPFVIDKSQSHIQPDKISKQ